MRTTSCRRRSRPANRPKGPTLNLLHHHLARGVLALLAAAFLVAFSPSGAALAQGLSDEVIRSSPVTADGQAQIEAFIKGRAKDLRSDATAGAIKAAKNALCGPPNNPIATESFRLAYSLKMKPVIAPLVADSKEELAINALRIAGTLGTKDGLDLALKGLDDQRPSVRMMGAMSAGLAISTARASNRALSQRNVTEGLDAFAGKMRAEKDVRVLDAMMLALDDAIQVEKAQLDGVRAKTTDILLAQGARLAQDKAFPPGVEAALAHATKTLGEALLKTDADKLPGVAVQEAAGVAGDVVAMILRRMDAPLAAPERSRLGLLAQQCESIVRQGTEMLGSKATKYNLDDLLLEGKDAEFREAAKRMFKDLTGEPFNRDSSRYPKP